MSKPNSDAELIQKVLILNDRNAYCDLVRKYQVEVRSYLWRLTLNQEWANDVAQETFLHGYRNLDQLKDRNKFRPWIYSVAHTQFLQWRRSIDNFEPEAEGGFAVSESDPFAATEVRILFKALRPEERSALTLCLAHQFTHREASEMLNLPLGTIKSLILRVREKIGVQS